MSRSSRPVQNPTTEEDEKTQVLKTCNTGLGRTGAQTSRQAGLPPPLIEAGPAATDAEPPTADASDDEPTRVLANSAWHTWMVSDGLSAPRELSEPDLLGQLKSGRVSAAAFAWQKGMNEWKKVTDISSLASAFKERSRMNSRPLPKRTSSPKVSSTIPSDRRDTPKLGRSMPSVILSPKSDSRRDTPKLGRSPVPLSAPVSGADVSAAGKATHTPIPDPTAGTANASNVPRAGADKEKAFSVPRPAAGRKPAPDEPVAKAEPVRVAPTESVVVAETAGSQALLKTKITRHREMTEPARSRLTWAQLQAAGRPPNILLWLLGAGGWAVAGVLAGLLIARGNHPTPPAMPAPVQAATLAPKPALSTPATVSPAEPVPSGSEKEAAPLAGPLPLPSPEPAPPSAATTKPPIAVPPLPRATRATVTPTLPVRPATPPTTTAAHPGPQPEHPPANDLNSPGF